MEVWKNGRKKEKKGKGKNWKRRKEEITENGSKEERKQIEKDRRREKNEPVKRRKERWKKRSTVYL